MQQMVQMNLWISTKKYIHNSLRQPAFFEYLTIQKLTESERETSQMRFNANDEQINDLKMKKKHMWTAYMRDRLRERWIFHGGPMPLFSILVLILSGCAPYAATAAVVFSIDLVLSSQNIFASLRMCVGYFFVRSLNRINNKESMGRPINDN